MDFLTIVTYIGKTAGAVASILAVITYIRPMVTEWLADKGILFSKKMPMIIAHTRGLDLAESVYEDFKNRHKWDWRPKVLKKKKELKKAFDNLKKTELTKKESKELIISTDIPKQKFPLMAELEMSDEEAEEKFNTLKETLIKAINHNVPTGFVKFDHKWTVIKSQIEPLESSRDYVGLLERRLAKFRRELKEALERA